MELPNSGRGAALGSERTLTPVAGVPDAGLHRVRLPRRLTRPVVSSPAVTRADSARPETTWAPPSSVPTSCL